MKFLKSILLSSILIIISCSSKLPDNISKILKSRCDSCHSYKIYKKIKTNDKKIWEGILHKMLIKGAKINEAEYEELLKYFTNNEKH